ncbi:hypothetical protein P7K49_027881 [Saguinus oedipus]|uniref:Uncharacterized protein n=1 Tax=Saguinus oedipus TaxID=9490 RepID=A0ABQ9UAQ0_SAGOE|nr:hypothetical protein P7K49_027881 [Saguinus oedipus]
MGAGAVDAGIYGICGCNERSVVREPERIVPSDIGLYLEAAAVTVLPVPHTCVCFCRFECLSQCGKSPNQYSETLETIAMFNDSDRVE